MKAIVYLCGKSIEIRTKQQQKEEKAQMQQTNEAHVVYDEDEE